MLAAEQPDPKNLPFCPYYPPFLVMGSFAELHLHSKEEGFPS
jgi:hypothetical protein